MSGLTWIGRMTEPASLLDRIEQEAVKADCDVASVLRMSIALGGQSGSEDLRAWASRELKGYQASDPLPDYRIIGAAIAIDGFTATHRVTGEQIAVLSLPQPARDVMQEIVELRSPIAELIDVVAEARRSGEGDVKFSIPGGTELAVLMNADLRSRGSMTQRVERVYKRSSATALVGVIDSVLTNLVELVAEIRAGLTSGTEVPGKALTDRAFNIVINGQGNRIEVGAQQTVITDSTNVAVNSPGVSQTAIYPPAGDLDALKDALMVAGLSNAYIEELVAAISADSDCADDEGPGPRVRDWLGKLALNSASTISTGVSVDVVVELIKHFFGV
jgi:hypothetical protein